jgi:microcystin-dependent protein
MSNPILSQIIAFGCNFAPRGWMACNGQLLPIAQNTALFSLLGTTYGGNGQTTFALPDLRGRAPLHFGQSPGTSNYTQGQMGGTESTTVGVNNMPIHTHPITVTASQGATAGPGGSESPVGTIPASSGQSENFAAVGAATGATGGLSVTATAAAVGGSQPISIVQPYVVLNWCIAIQGIYPSRN